MTVQVPVNDQILMELDPSGRIVDLLVEGKHLGVVTATTDPITGMVVSIVVSSTAPSDADGRPDGTIYVQTV